MVVTVWFFLSLILALVIPNIGDVIKITGSLAMVFTFIFPGICLLKCTIREPPSNLYEWSWAFLTLSIMLIGIGGLLFCVVLPQGIKILINGRG